LRDSMWSVLRCATGSTQSFHLAIITRTNASARDFLPPQRLIEWLAGNLLVPANLQRRHRLRQEPGNRPHGRDPSDDGTRPPRPRAKEHKRALLFFTLVDDLPVAGDWNSGDDGVDAVPGGGKGRVRAADSAGGRRQTGTREPSDPLSCTILSCAIERAVSMKTRSWRTQPCGCTWANGDDRDPVERRESACGVGDGGK
jgi:hypothetical protein